LIDFLRFPQLLQARRNRWAVVQRWSLAFCALCGCEERPASELPSAPALAEVRLSGALEDPFIVEQSGLARSASSPDVYWTHNDSGNLPQLFAIDSTGASRGRWNVTNASNGDWEAIAVGACDAGSCVYLADVGDNNARRKSVSVWRVREPTLPSAENVMSGDAPKLSTESAQRIRIRYPDEAHDVEAMWVSPDTSVWLLTKRPLRDAAGQLRRALLFRVPVSAWRDSASRDSVRVVAELVDSLPLVPVNGDSDTWVTDASFTADGPHGARLAVRTYQEVAVFRADSLSGRPGDEVARCSLRALRERNGEAVAWMPDGRLLFGNEGKGGRIFTGRC
jgi:hypothetical protein